MADRMMDLHQQIDIYCERLRPGLWAEPINAATNLAFFLAAGFAYYLAKRENALNVRSCYLIALIIIIGVGSSLFHTLATTWAVFADALPILIYQISFIFLYARYVIKINLLRGSMLMIAFFQAMYFFMQLPGAWFNGSLRYGPALLFLCGLGIYHWRRSLREKYSLLIAAGIFLLSLACRAMDMPLCTAFSLGTHFAWHILNGLVLYLSMRAFILNARK